MRRPRTLPGLARRLSGSRQLLLHEEQRLSPFPRLPHIDCLCTRTLCDAQLLSIMKLKDPSAQLQRRLQDPRALRLHRERAGRAAGDGQCNSATADRL